MKYIYFDIHVYFITFKTNSLPGKYRNVNPVFIQHMMNLLTFIIINL